MTFDEKSVSGRFRRVPINELAGSHSGRRASAADTSNLHVLLSSIERELKRAHADMAKLDPAPYFLSYSVHDQSSGAAVGILGDLVSSVQGQRRTADVITRIGSPALDNSHQENRRSAIHSGVLSLEDDADSISRELWLLTYRGYRKAAHAFVNVKTKTQVKAQEEDTSPDFSQESPVTYGENEPLASLPDQKVLERLARQWEELVKDYRRILGKSLATQNTENAKEHRSEGPESLLVDANGTHQTKAKKTQPAT